VKRRARLALELARAVFWLVLIELSLRRRDLPATCRRLGICWDLDTAAPAAVRRAVLPRRMRTPVRACCLAVAHWPAGDTCLRRCLVLGHRLRALGPVLRIGVRRTDTGEFSAHSWLEIDGRTLDAAAEDYVTLGRP
jgi:hypothetical protein